MQVFVSHSSAQKAFANSLIEKCPKSIDFWIDAENIKKGDDFKRAIDDALDEKSAFCVLIVDEKAAASEWVAYEIEKARAREKKEGRVVLIPIVLSLAAWDQIAPLAGEHKSYIFCQDQEEDSIRLVATRLTRAIFDWLIERDDIRGLQQLTSEQDGAYATAESTFAVAARALKNAISGFRQDSPATLTDILELVQATAPGLFKNEDELRKALEELRQQNYLHGFYFDGETAFLVKERFHDKKDVKVKIKQRLAKVAARMVQSDQVIALDGGTTTLAIASELCIHLTSGNLSGLKVITNSIPVAMKFVESLALKNAGDRDSTCQVTLLGGTCRPSTMCTTIDEPETELASILAGLDIAFIGASGLVGADGFGVTNSPEIAAKTGFQANAKRAVMVCDATKFEVSLKQLTNEPTPSMTIVTEQAAAKRLEKLKDANPAWRDVTVRYCD